MIKKLLNIFLTFCIILSTCFSVFAQEQVKTSSIDIDGKSAILIDTATGQVLYEKNPDEQLSPASVTKLMTLLLIYDSIENGKIKWEDIVTVSEFASSMGGSQVFLEPNEQQTVKDLTKSIAIASANDAAVAMAEFISGSETEFVSLMNSKAKELGMENTNFQNACGLDENVNNHYMSARDIAILSREILLKYPQITEFTTTWQDTITHTTKKGESEFGLTNTNKLIKWYNGATGLKTGSTNKALYCLSGSATRDGLSLVAVIMGAPDPKVRFKEVMEMLDYGFANYTILKGEPKDKIVGNVNIFKGKEEVVNATVKEEVSILTKKGASSEIKTEVKLPTSLKAPIEKGSKIGEIVYYYEEKEVGKSDLVAQNDIKKASLSDMIRRLSIKWFS